MTTTHTAASLAALHADDPRKLDALAHETVFQQRVEEVQGHNTAFLIVANVGTLPDYSASLDAAAMLEARLAERGLQAKYGEMICDPRSHHIQFASTVFRIATTTAHERTIAAVLAAQEAK